MLTKEDISQKLGVSVEIVCRMHAMRILPEPIKIGGKFRWRETDIKKFRRYLLKRAECRQRGVDPDSPKGPAVPIYTTAGPPRTDPRLLVANEAERRRQRRSRTLAKGATPIGPQPEISLPEPKSTEVSEGQQ